MSSTNNIYIPYHNDLHRRDSFNFYKEYYNKLGFNVVEFDSDGGTFNQPLAINKLFENHNEDVYVIIDNVLINRYALVKSIKLSKENNCLVKPAHRTFIIDDDAGEIFTNTLINNESIDSFYFSTLVNFTIWPMGGAWVIAKEHVNLVGGMNDSITHPDLFDFEYCYRSAYLNKIVFNRSDSYKNNLIKLNIPFKSMYLSKHYIESMKKIIPIKEVFQTDGYGELAPTDPAMIDTIFNHDRYLTTEKYM